MEARYRPLEWLTLWVQGVYSFQDYLDSKGHWDDNKNRSDGLWTAAGGMNFRVHDHLAIGLSYRYMNNKSLEDFTYDRHMANLAVLTHF
jgi:opacity protein-like surface antigen